jgi:hypothetical protein
MIAQSLRGTIALGFGLAAVTVLVAMLLAGAGHGWNTPFLVSIVFWGVYPMSLYVWRGHVRYAKIIMLNLVICAIVGDAWLIIGTISEASYLAASIHVNGIAGFLTAAAWSALWVSWQVILARVLLARFVEGTNA